MDHGTVHGMSPPLILSSYTLCISRRKGLTKRGICFTYATMFALESLAIAGETHENSAAVRRACDFLVSKQMEDGGWGETYMVRPLYPSFSHHPCFPFSRLSRSDLSNIYSISCSLSRTRLLPSHHFASPRSRSARLTDSHAYQWNTHNTPNPKSSKLPGQSSH